MKWTRPRPCEAVYPTAHPQARCIGGIRSVYFRPYFGRATLVDSRGVGPPHTRCHHHVRLRILTSLLSAILAGAVPFKLMGLPNPTPDAIARSMRLRILTGLFSEEAERRPPQQQPLHLRRRQPQRLTILPSPHPLFDIIPSSSEHLSGTRIRCWKQEGGI
ncbi:hypothetical protein K458DRAFT_27714 [Lentithecium fluviatile CBS 122367]|uniref:Uncharacterized protein n=1 Tax=Lentithecium fluviatile CBS 122367 TaxID=1168545 RepID=A0A6G1J2X6_9PLEO|nr:hypothetical protein K458DRAFT_27714 [Lentithecium fluviatile CBS 122367]